MERILLIEDDDTFSILLTAYLQTAGYTTVRVSSAHEGLRRCHTDGWAGIIVDLSLPDEDGLVLVRLLRARTLIPILVVTGRDSRDDRLAALEVGADDFIPKPFEPRELLLRLNNVIRRSRRQETRPRTHVPCAGGILDLAGHSVTASSGATIELPSRDFLLLRLLAQNLDRVLTRAQIIDALAGASAPESERAIDIRISRLRRRLTGIGLDAALLRTVHGTGYKLVSDHTASAS